MENTSRIAGSLGGIREFVTNRTKLDIDTGDCPVESMASAYGRVATLQTVTQVLFPVVLQQAVLVFSK